MTRYAESGVRAIVLLSFPATVAMLWPLVPHDAHALFLAMTGYIVVVNIAAYLVPWERLPRWTELVPSMSLVVAVWLFAATVGGLADGYGIILLIPLLWLIVYGDTADILAGFALAMACLLTPIERLLPFLPEQGSPRQVAVFAVVLFVLFVGVRPVIWQLREQVQATRRAVQALHGSQAALVHDLRNPLAALHSLAVLTEQQLDGDGSATADKVREYAQVSRDSVRRAERIIDGVLELSRSGEQLPWVEQVELVPLVESVAAGVDGIRLEWGPVPTAVTAHGPSLSRLFANLLQNAALHGRQDAAGAGPVLVTVSGEEGPGGWTITVADDGSGIDPAEAPAVFEPWHRGARARQAGSGLGLAIVAGIVDQHGGTIACSNREPHGASFTFTLERRPQAAASGDPTPGPGGEPRSQSAPLEFEHA